MTQFYIDLEAAKPAEELVRQTLSKLTTEYQFIDVADLPQYYSYGDILATGKNGSEFFIDVKDDSRIADTKRILCEEEVYFKQDGYTKDGFMYSNYDYLCIVSKKESRIYIIDFKVLKEIYKKGEPRNFEHPTQETFGYLLDLYLVKKYKALKAVINYDKGDVVCY
jgi:hypothetical protein